jgi:hypothetical protein
LPKGQYDCRIFPFFQITKLEQNVVFNHAKRNVLPVEQLGPDLELEQSLPPGNKKYLILFIRLISEIGNLEPNHGPNI